MPRFIKGLRSRRYSFVSSLLLLKFLSALARAAALDVDRRSRPFPAPIGVNDTKSRLLATGTDDALSSSLVWPFPILDDENLDLERHRGLLKLTMVETRRNCCLDGTKVSARIGMLVIMVRLRRDEGPSSSVVSGEDQQGGRYMLADLAAAEAPRLTKGG